MRNSLVRNALRRKFAVTLNGSEGVFSGILVDCDDLTFVFDQCETVPKARTEVPEEIVGRVYVDRIAIAYLQRLDP